MSKRLHDAVEMEDLDLLRSLLASGGDPNERDDYGMPLLHHAIDVQADGAIQTGRVMESDTTRLLLEAGADPRIAWEGKSALEFARHYGHTSAAELIARRLES
jgi:ankyrin repeat protein